MQKRAEKATGALLEIATTTEEEEDDDDEEEEDEEEEEEGSCRLSTLRRFPKSVSH